MSDSPIILDTSHFPVLYIAYPRPFTGDDWAQMLVTLDRYLDGKERFGWINDARTPHLPTARDRTVLAEHQKRRAPDYKRLVKGVSTVSSSRVIRGIITAIEWINPLPFPHEMMPTVREAEIFVRQRLGLPTDRLPVAAEREKVAAV